MPIVFLLLVRTFRAFVATFRLLTNVEVMRALPWAYIRRLPFRNWWIGIIATTLAVSLGCALLAVLIPGTTGGALAQAAWFASLSGIASSWIRALVQRRRLRR